MLTGVFSTAEGFASVAETNPSGPRTMAVADVGATNATISVTAGTMAEGWGVVFRYVGPFNFWYLEAVPKFAVFNVVRVADGQAQTVGRTSLVDLVDGMTVDISLLGQQILVSIDGRVIYSGKDDHALGGTEAGLMLVRDSTEATWDRFAATPNERTPGPTIPVLRPPLESPSTDPTADSPDDSTTTTELDLSGFAPAESSGR